MNQQKTPSKFIIGTFYTTGTPYEEVVNEYFLPSVMKFMGQIEYRMYAIPSKGSWQKNVAEKPNVILSMLDSIPKDKNLVFVDADATIEQYPIIFDEIDEKYDLAFHRLNWETWYKNGIKRKELLSGTMYFKNNENVRKLLKQWYEDCIQTDSWEQQVLENILSHPHDLKIFKLSVEYCYIKTLPDGREPHVKCSNPFILHHQASRKLKKLISPSG